MSHSVDTSIQNRCSSTVYQDDDDLPQGIIVVVVVLTLTRIIKSMITGQDPVTRELGENTNTSFKVVHAYITADAIHASTRTIYN